MAHVRIHVERVIGVLKNRYTILQSRLPLSLIKRKGDEVTATVDKLLTVSAALTNLELRRICCVNMVYIIIYETFVCDNYRYH